MKKIILFIGMALILFSFVFGLYENNIVYISCDDIDFNSTDQTYIDLSSYGHNAAKQYSNTTNGILSQSCIFNSTSNLARLTLPNTAEINTTIRDNFTISLWINRTVQSIEGRIFYIRGRNAQPGISLAANTFLDNYNISFTFINSSDVVNRLPQISLSNYQWYYYTLVKAGSNFSQYINGNLNQSIDIPGSGEIGTLDNGVNANFTIGNSLPGYSNMFNGSIDEFSIYNRSISLQEITNLYNGSNGFNPFVENKLDNCTVYDDIVLNATFRHLINDTPIFLNYETYLENLNRSIGGTLINFSFKGVNQNNFLICSSRPDHAIFTDLFIKYVNGTTIFEHSSYQTELVLPTKYLSLYVDGGTSQVVFSVKDLNDDPIQNAYIKVLKFIVGEGGYKQTESLRTDDNGETIGNLVLIDDFYRFIIDYQGTTRLIEPETGGVRILTTAKNFVIDLAGGDFFDNFDIVTGISTSLVYNNLTNTFSFTWSDPSSRMHQGCLKVNKRNTTHDLTLSDSCLASPTGTALYTISPVNGSSFIALGYFVFDDIIPWNSIAITFSELFDFSRIGDSKDSLFVTFLLTTSLVLVGLPFPAISMMLLLFGLIGTIILGLFKIGFGIAIGFIILIVIHLWKMQK